MKKYSTILILLAMALCALAISAGSAGAKDKPYLSPQSIVSDISGKTLYVAELTAKKIAIFDVAKGKVSSEISLKIQPAGLALASDGSRLFVTGGVANGKVLAIDVRNRKVVGQVKVGHSPMAPVPSPDGKNLYVCNRFNNNVSVIDLASMKATKKIAVPREPYAAAITPDGKYLYVANHLPDGPADLDYVAAKVSVINTAKGKVVKTIELPNGSEGLRGVCVSPDGKYVYITHILARYQLPTTQLERGWMNTNALSIVDVEKQELLNTVLLDDVDLGAANPWGVACTPDGKYLCVALAGTHDVSVIEREAMHGKLDRVAAGEKVSDASSSADDVPNDLSFLVGTRRRLKLAGNGPRGLAIAGNKVYAAEYFTGTLAVVDLDPEVYHRPKSLALGDEPAVTQVRTGEKHFNDAELCFQKWQSCASCHPDARADGLNWDLMNDGMGNPKNAKSMLLAHSTPPSMITGIRPDAETAVRAGIKFIQFAVRPEEDARAIDAYLKSLKPTPSPHLVKGKLSASAKRGEKVFDEANCSMCHTPPHFTDMDLYDLGTGVGMEEDQEFDTPTLIEIWRSGPYLYDGRAATMKDMITKHNPDDSHGDTSGLTPKQINDLVEFVLSQ